VTPVHSPDARRQSSQQAVSQRTRPLPQVNPHDVPSQVAVAFGGGAGQGVQEPPQLSTDVRDRHSPLHSWWAVSQLVASHRTPVQVVVSAPSGQMAQLDPHIRLLLGQPRPHELPSQVAKPPLGTGQFAQLGPHAVRLAMGWQVPLQACMPDVQAVATHADPEQAVAVAFAVGQATQSPPQSR
jgi:hypothetical protein